MQRGSLVSEVIQENDRTVVTDKIKAYGGDNSILALAIAEVESQFKIDAKNPLSTAKGVFQFLDGTWEEQCEGDVLNVDDNIACGMKLIEKGELWRWLESYPKWIELLSDELKEEYADLEIRCSCVKFVQSKGLLVRGDAWDIESNSYPMIKGGVTFSYGHIAYIEEITDNGMWISESNKSKCAYGQRFVSWTDKYIKGFVKPPQLYSTPLAYNTFSEN